MDKGMLVVPFNAIRPLHTYKRYNAPSGDWSTVAESCFLWSKRCTAKPPWLDKNTICLDLRDTYKYLNLVCNEIHRAPAPLKSSIPHSCATFFKSYPNFYEIAQLSFLILFENIFSIFIVTHFASYTFSTFQFHSLLCLSCSVANCLKASFWV